MAAAVPITVFTLELWVSNKDDHGYTKWLNTIRLPGVFMTQEEATIAAHSYMRNNDDGQTQFFKAFTKGGWCGYSSKVAILHFTVGADSVAVNTFAPIPEDMKAEFEDYIARNKKEWEECYGSS